MIRCGKLHIAELSECYKPGKSPILMTERSFLKRVLSFNFQEQYRPSFIVAKTNIISPHVWESFHIANSLHRNIASGASALVFCFLFGGVIIVWRFHFLESADTQSFIVNFNCLSQWHINYKNSQKARNLYRLKDIQL